jgi:hypothetical protein
VRRRLSEPSRSGARLLLVEERLRLEVEAGERPPRLLARFLRGGEEDVRAGARERDVEEPPLLFECPACLLGLVNHASTEQLAVEEGVLGAREGWEATFDEVADEDGVPLEPLRLVHGQEGDGVK